MKNFEQLGGELRHPIFNRKDPRHMAASRAISCLSTIANELDLTPKDHRTLHDDEMWWCAVKRCHASLIGLIGSTPSPEATTAFRALQDVYMYGDLMLKGGDLGDSVMYHLPIDVALAFLEIAVHSAIGRTNE